MAIYSDYDPFARVYNKYWGDEFTRFAFPLVERLVLRRLPPGASILDLCCGTGQMAATLTALGYSVTGVDGSPEMLRFARQNAPAATFVHADARSFTLPHRFDAAICIFDSLNHVMTAGELEDVFRCVRAALRGGAPFFFDLNLEAGFSLAWHDNFGIVEDDLLCVVRTSYDPENKVACFDVTVMTQDNGWKRTDFTLRQKCHSPEEVLAALARAGLTGAEVYSLDDRRGLVPLAPGAERAFFLCCRR